MINSRHILNLSIELITKPQALGRTSCYKCNGTKREAGRAGVGGGVRVSVRCREFIIMINSKFAANLS